MASAAWAIDPYYFWPPAFLTLFLKHFLLVWPFAMAITGWAKQGWGMVAGMIILMASLIPLRNELAINPRAGGGEQGPVYRVVTYNVQGFGWYDDEKTPRQILENIANLEPDLLFLQDYYDENGERGKVIEPLKKRLGLSHVAENLPYAEKQGKFGQAIYSRFPLTNSGGLGFRDSSSNGAMWADMALPSGKIIRVVNAHLQSNSLRLWEFSPAEPLGRWRLIFLRNGIRKLMKGFRRRSIQVHQLRAAIDGSPYDVLLGGDFNDLPSSFSYMVAQKGLEDTWVRKGVGLGSTYAGAIPFLRIDYLLHSKGIEPVSIRVGTESKGSDHYPVIGEFRLE